MQLLKKFYISLDVRLKKLVFLDFILAVTLGIVELLVIIIVFGYIANFLDNQHSNNISFIFEYISIIHVLLFIIIRFFITLLYHWSKANSAFEIHNYFTNVIILKVFSYDGPPLSSEDIIRLSVVEVGQINAFYNQLSQLILDLSSSVLFILGLLFFINVEFIVILPIALLLCGFPIYKIGLLNKQVGHVRIIRENERLQSLMKFMSFRSLHLGNVKLKNYHLDNLQSSITNLMAIGKKHLFFSNLTKPFLDIIFLVSIVLIISFHNTAKELDFTTILILVAGMLRLYPTITKVAASINSIRGLTPSLEFILAKIIETGLSTPVFFKETSKYIEISRESINWKKIPSLLNSSVTLEKASIKRGDIIQIVGKSGIGKTIFLKSLIKIYDKKFPNSTSFVSITDKLFPGNVKNNILDINDNNNTSYYNDIFEIIKDIACIDFDIEHVILNDSTGLSEGQRARVLLARALKTQPKLLILDELLSVIDIKRRKHIINNLKNYCYKNKVILILVGHIGMSEIKTCHLK